MANEIFTSGLGNLLFTETVAGMALLLLADRESPRNHPCIVYLGDAAGSGSTVHDVPLVGLDGYDSMAAVAENSSTSNTALTDAKAAVTVARQAIQRQVSDLARTVDMTGAVDPERLAQSAVGEAEMRFVSLIAGLGDDFSSTVGTSGVDMTVGDFYDAQFTLMLASVPEPYLWMPHPRQYADFEADLRSEGGAVQYDPNTRALLGLRGPGFKGNFNGVDIFTSTKVPTANGGADRASGMWGRGAIGYREASVRPSPGLLAAGAIFAGPIMIEFERDAAGALEKIVGNYYVGVVEIEDSRGVTIVTDA